MSDTNANPDPSELVTISVPRWAIGTIVLALDMRARLLEDAEMTLHTGMNARNVQDLSRSLRPLTGWPE